MSSRRLSPALKEYWSYQRGKKAMRKKRKNFTIALISLPVKRKVKVQLPLRMKKETCRQLRAL